MAVVESGAVQFQAACGQGAAAVVAVAAANVGAAGEDGALAVVETAAVCFQAAEGQTAAVGQFAVYVQIGAPARFDGAAVVQTAGDADAAVGRSGNRGVAAVAVIAVAVIGGRPLVAGITVSAAVVTVVTAVVAATVSTVAVVAFRQADAAAVVQYGGGDVETAAVDLAAVADMGAADAGF